MYGIRLRTGVTERDIFQFQLIAFCYGNILTIFKPERFGIIQKFTETGYVQALLVQRAHLLQNTHNPRSKCSYSREVQQKF